MGLKKSYVVIYHDDGYGDDLLRHINIALKGKDMEALSVLDDDILGAAKEAFGALVGSSAKNDSVQGRAKLRLRKALGINDKSNS